MKMDKYGMMRAVVLFGMVVAVALAAADEKTMEEKCGADFTKLTVCLSYATGKGAAPSKDCCAAVKGIRESEPECLCFIMQQTHAGNDKIKSMGIQEAKLFQLPTACALQNTTLSECPKLLGLAANDPAAAIFNSNSTAAVSTTPVGTATSQSQSSTDTKNASNNLTGAPLPIAIAIAIAVATFLLFDFSARLISK